VRTARGAKERRDGEKKSAETGNRQVPRFGFSPGSAGLPVEDLDPAIQKTFAGDRIAIPRASEFGCARRSHPHGYSLCLFRRFSSVTRIKPAFHCVCGGDSSKPSVFYFCFGSSFWRAKRPREPTPRKRRERRGLQAEPRAGLWQTGQCCDKVS
jgi:hypothetical protein